jgi:hypothetical protein
MPLLPVAVEEFDFDFVSGSDNGDLSTEGDPVEKVKAEGKKVYNNSLVMKVENFENANVINGTGAGVSVGALKVKAGGLPVLRETDIFIVSGTGTSKTTGQPTAFTTAVEITDAKQTKVKAV